MVENDDDLCLPHCIALAIAHAEHYVDPTNIECLRNYRSMHKKDRRYVKLRDTSSLQKRTALKYQSMVGIALHSLGLLEHIPLYKKALGVGITVISAWGGNKRVYQSDPQYTMQIILYHIHSDINDWGHYAVITCINALLGKSYYCSHCNMAPVIIVKSGATYADEMDVWWRMNHPQPCAIQTTLLATQTNAWRLTRQNVEGRAHLCVTPCCSVLIAMSSCAITKKKRLGVEQTHLWQMLLLQLQVHLPSQRGQAPLLHALY